MSDDSPPRSSEIINLNTMISPDDIDLDAILAGGDTLIDFVAAYLYGDDEVVLQPEGLDHGSSERPRDTPLSQCQTVSQSAVTPSSPPRSGMPEGSPSDVLELEAILASGDTVPNFVSTYLHADNGLPLLTSAGDLQPEGLDRPKVTPLPPPPMVSQSAATPSSPPRSGMSAGALSHALELEAILASGDTAPNFVSTYLVADNDLALLTSAVDLEAEGLNRPKVTPLPQPPMVSQSAVTPSSPPWSSMPEGSLSHGLDLEAILASGNTAPNLVSEYLYADNNLTLLTSAVDLQAEGLDRPRVTLGVEPRTSDRIISKATDLSELAPADTSKLDFSVLKGQKLVGKRKALTPLELEQLALVDPKRARRICANRESAFRSKERKMQYIKEKEQKVSTLQLETSTLSAQLTMLQVMRCFECVAVLCKGLRGDGSCAVL